MSWSARISNIIDDAAQFDSVKIVVEYYSKLGRENFFETYPFSVEDEWSTIRDVVLKKLAVINMFRNKVEELKKLIGQIITPDTAPDRAVKFNITVDKPVLK